MHANFRKGRIYCHIIHIANDFCYLRDFFVFENCRAYDFILIAVRDPDVRMSLEASFCYG